MALRRALIALALLTVACGTLPSPILRPHTEPIPHLGLNLGPERVTPFYLDTLARFKRPLTLRVPVHSAEQGRQILRALDRYPDLSALLLVEQPDVDLAASLAVLKDEPQLAGIELGNELDLFGLTPLQFRDFVTQSTSRLLAGGFAGDILSGGIYTVDAESLAYAAPMLAQLPCDQVFAVHLYGDSSDAVLAQLQHAAGCHAIAVTELGMPSRTPQEELAQTAYLAEQIRAFARLWARYAIIYQLVSGPSASNLDNFGLLRFDHSQKPAFDLFRSTP